MVKKLLDFEKVNLKGKTGGIKLEQVSSEDIAIIGLSLHFPKADNAEEFWDIIENGIDCVSDIPEGRRKDMEALLAYRNIKGASFAKKAYLEEIDKFDYSFFGLSPKEASLIDPNQRIFC